MANENMISFITGIRYETDLLKCINGMTFLFDQNWSSANSDKATLPICCFGVTKMEEIATNEVSTKQLLFFNSSSTSGAEKQTSGLMNVVADNIVLKPRQYKLSIVLPANDLVLPIGNQAFNTYLNTNIQGAIFNGDNNNPLMNIVSGLNSPAIQLTILSLLKDLTIRYNFSEGFDTWFNNITETPMFNKNSLDAMRDNRSILKFKSWEGWRYKYVSIVEVSLSKEPTDEGVFTGSVILQEMPIMSVASKTRGKKEVPYNNLATDFIGNTIKKLVGDAEV